MRALGLVALLAACAAAQPCVNGVLAIGDSRTADNHDGITPWPARVLETTVVNFAVSGRTWSGCVTDYATNAPRVHRGTAVQCGVNDLLASTDGHTLFTTEKTWVELYASGGNVIYWFNIPGFKNYDSTAGKLTARNNFNADFTTYCLAPAANVKCIDIATLLKDPMDADALLGAYTIDGLHYTNAGQVIVATAFENTFP